SEKDLVGNGFANPGSSFAVTERDVWKTLEMGTEKRADELRKFVTIVPGWLQETMPGFMSDNGGRRIALVHCDPDLYEPIFATLNNVWGGLSSGGVIIIGSLNNPEYMGKTEALNDFLKTIPPSEYKLE